MTFDLTGLPPTPAEVEAFLADESPEAFARVVDRLLGSPRYGERWGRHWLDLARYADSNGLDENVAHGNAWRYRDYVIAAFNADKPYDRFLTEQVAGDLLPPTGDEKDDRDRLIATGFLALGPKVLAEPDQTKMEMDIIDEQLDTLGRTFMGLTIGCARCHDHKFDPILASDYYGLAGIFKSTQTMDSFKTVAKWHENSIATDEDRARVDAHQKKVADRKAAIRRLVLAATPRLLDGGPAGVRPPRGLRPARPVRGPRPAEETPGRAGRAREGGGRAPHGDGGGRGEGGRPQDPPPREPPDARRPGAPAGPRGPHRLAGPGVREGDERQARAGPLDGRPGTPADRPRDGQPDLALALRPGARAHPRQLRPLGDKPVHRELLDWLARRFVEDGWSIKAMHRRILLSSTYRMSDRDDPDAAKVDPEGRYHWRWKGRRLEAEEVRDALLAVSGTLDPTMGGSLLHVKNRDYFFDHTSKDKTQYDSRRRSVYLPVVRNNTYDVFQLFDFPDAERDERRPLDHDRGAAGALPDQQRPGHRPDADDGQGAGRGVRTATTPGASAGSTSWHSAARRRTPRRRGPRPSSGRVEAEAGADGTKDDDRRLSAWQALCQVLVSSNEFFYIR